MDVYLSNPNSNVRAAGFARHDDIYDRIYFSNVEQTARRSARAIAEHIVRNLHPAVVLDVRKFDLRVDEYADGHTADLAVSTEVGEHLPDSCADHYVDLMCRAADRVVFSSASPGQDGIGHLNEQPHDYWIREFADRGFSFDRLLSLRWRADWQARGIAPFYHQNVMIFRRAKGVYFSKRS